ncbi:unnamed protein product [Alopecurus aequalis]
MDSASPLAGVAALFKASTLRSSGMPDKGGRPIRIPPYFWGEGPMASNRGGFPMHAGYSEARALVGKGAVADLTRLTRQAEDMVAEVFASIGKVGEEAARPRVRVVQLRLSPELALWKSTQHAMGNVLPPKGKGLSQASLRVLAVLGAADWPEAMTTNNAMFGSGMANLLNGAADVRTLFSNYVTDMGFYNEHWYNHVFPSFHRLLHDGLVDDRALRTPGGRERREVVAVGASYIQAKIALEAAHRTRLTDCSAQLDRHAAQVILLADSSILGMGAEATARGFDAGAVMSDLVFSKPATDVVDVGSDMVNSEVINSLLNVADIAASGVVSEPALRAIYDAYAAACARMFTQRWHEPLARMCAVAYTWHIQNDRHMFLRRALLGWSKARKSPARPQREQSSRKRGTPPTPVPRFHPPYPSYRKHGNFEREGDLDEVFNTDFRTTGFSGGEETCNHVRRFLLDRQRQDEEGLLGALWWSLVTGPLEYVRQGEVDEQREQHLAESSRLHMAQLFSKGLVVEMVWLLGHVSQHAWQVNYLFQAAMFGSLLDGGALTGKLDRTEEETRT